MAAHAVGLWRCGVELRSRQEAVDGPNAHRRLGSLFLCSSCLHLSPHPKGSPYGESSVVGVGRGCSRTHSLGFSKVSKRGGRAATTGDAKRAGGQAWRQAQRAGVAASAAGGRSFRDSAKIVTILLCMNFFDSVLADAIKYDKCLARRAECTSTRPTVRQRLTRLERHHLTGIKTNTRTRWRSKRS